MKEQVISKKIVELLLVMQTFIKYKCKLSLQCKGDITIMN